MKLEPNDDQRQLQDTVARLMADSCSFAQRRAAVATTDGWSKPAWRQMAEMGLPALYIPEEQGGLGGGASDVALVMAEFGKSLALEPLLASSVLCTAALRSFPADGQGLALLPLLAQGDLIMAWAHDEAAARHDFHRVETRAIRDGDGWSITGRKQNVLHAGSAAKFIVSARVREPTGGDGGIALFLVDAEAGGLDCRRHRLIDDSPAGELTFDGVSARALGDPAETSRQSAALEAVRRIGISALCAEAVGVMESALSLSASYTSTRQQFGKPLSANQAVRHHLADMQVALETCRSAALIAAASVDDPEGEASVQDLHRAKLLIGQHGRSLCHTAIQLHGGIGMTEEYQVGHCLRRLLVIDQLFGSAEWHSARLEECLFPPAQDPMAPTTTGDIQ